jgi:hypothetical protein
VLVVDWFLVSRQHWDLGDAVRSRWGTLAAWALGFVAYQLVNPGYVSWWARGWARVDTWLHFTPTSWMSASIISFVVAALAAVPLGRLGRRKDVRADSS